MGTQPSAEEWRSPLFLPLKTTVVGGGRPETGKSRVSQVRWGWVGLGGRVHEPGGEGMALIIIAGDEWRDKMSKRLRGTVRGIGALSGTLLGHELEGKNGVGPRVMAPFSEEPPKETE